jgi:acetyl-CoA acyltransferase 1
MTRSAFGGGGGKPEPPNAKIFLNQSAKDCLLPMGITSENVAADYGVDRKTQDTLAVSSHVKANAAQKSGKFDAEIVPVTVRYKDEKTGADKEKVVKADDGIRADTTLEGLSKLKRKSLIIVVLSKQHSNLTY